MADIQHMFNICTRLAHLSRDPNTRVGAIAVSKGGQIIARGWNRFPMGIREDHRIHNRDTKLRTIIHAEQALICAAARVGVSLEDSTVYLAATDNTGATWGGPPCTRCAVHLIEAGVRRIVAPPMKEISKWKDDLLEAQKLLDEAEVATSYIDSP